MIELRWLATEIEVPYYSNPPVYGEKARFTKTKRRKLQYRQKVLVNYGEGVGYRNEWSDWIDVPEVNDETK